MIKAGVGLALGVAGFLYAHSRGIGFAAAAQAIAAFLITYPFYLAMGFRDVRERIAGARLPWALLALAVLPYLVLLRQRRPFRGAASPAWPPSRWRWLCGIAYCPSRR